MGNISEVLTAGRDSSKVLRGQWFFFVLFKEKILFRRAIIVQRIKYK